jgi:hypothetical protein
MKNFIANLTLIASVVLWVFGVDYIPVMAVLGFPLLLCALSLWVRWSNLAKRIIYGKSL